MPKEKTAREVVLAYVTALNHDNFPPPNISPIWNGCG
jgi:hypothetical protein